MYDAFYGLSHDPFRLTPDSQSVFSHPSYARARAYLEYGLLRGEGFVLVTGPPGSGKTTLQHDLTRQLPRSARVAEIVTSRVEPDDLLRLVAERFDFQPPYRDKASLLETLRRGLENGQGLGERHVLVVDDAQDLPEASLEELRLLSNLSLSDTPLLQILLLGQPELRELMRRPGLEQLHQRTIASCRLVPLSAEESRNYILHRLGNAGWRGDPALTEAALKVLHYAAEGTPRRLNLLATRLFIHGFAENRHRLTVADVRVALEEMQDEVVGNWQAIADDAEREEGPIAVPEGAEAETATAGRASEPVVDLPTDSTHDAIDDTPPILGAATASAGPSDSASSREEDPLRVDPVLEASERDLAAVTAREEKRSHDAHRRYDKSRPRRRASRTIAVAAVLTLLVVVVTAATPAGDWLLLQFEQVTQAITQVAAAMMDQYSL